MSETTEKSIEALAAIAEIAHAGGLDNISYRDAMNAIRRLSLPYWDQSNCNARQAGESA